MADSSTNILKQRMQQLCSAEVPINATCVLYIMSRDQRMRDNDALLAAQKHAISLKLPLQVAFLLYRGTGYRAREHYEFMLDGLTQVGADLVKKNINFEIIDTAGDSHAAAEKLLTETQPGVVYMDFNPLNGPRKLRQHIADIASCSVFYVDAHNIVPVWVASDRQEFAARTIRPKIQKKLPDFLIDYEQIDNHPYGSGFDKTSYPVLRKSISSVASNGQKLSWKSGEKAALRALGDFIDNRLDGYAEKRNDPSSNHLSELSPYLHFGQISTRRIALSVTDAMHADSSLTKDAEAFLEEMIIRRELSDNYCHYNHNYANLTGAPQWAQDVLAKHADDPREFVYSYEAFRSAQTHDSAWNAAQRQLVQHGKMHGYMRMYWAKKVLEWSDRPETALRTLIQFNDHYSIDGGDPNGYVGILWSVAGLHDRPWGERPIYGTVRSMVYGGLKRKFDIVAYEQQWL